MHYTLHQLQIFLKITEKESITKASEELYLTQPAVSIQLKKFQDQFPIPLTEVIGRKLYITDFGKEIAAAAEKILEEVEEINYKTMSYSGQLTGKLKISIVSTGKYVMPYFLSDFINQHEGIDLVLDVTNKAQVIESLKRNTVDFSLVSVLPDHLQIDKIQLMENQLYLVGNTEQKFDKKMYSTSILAELPLIYREQGSGTRHTMERFIQKNDLKVRKNMELTSNEAVKQAVLAGLGYSIMPLIGIRNELKTGRLQIIPVKGFPIKSNWHLIWLKNKKFSLVADAFLKYLESEKDTVIKQKFENI
ncbi:LysR substrate-binding domain-containing protein [Aquimarina sp. MMG016]|uniref:LysR substrate-binding domain-containing protein n=1 Tax=Aquimarina sp. MMG016 TaxID=2822690 RepID=UPI001B3A0CBB|nr:LysR substrate-binding domain-containing protein [Aquimarina sp. MMG016]MBQ4820817.1 LysR family transcriptional regulator [Aquimarina sp. MMG016]